MIVIVQKHQIEIELLVISKRNICHLYRLKCWMLDWPVWLSNTYIFT